MWFKYLWMAVFGIWLIISNVILIKAFIKAKFSIHTFEAEFLQKYDSGKFIIGTIIVDVIIAVVLIFIFKLWILAIIIWGLIGLYLVKELFIDKREFDDITILSQLWCMINILILGAATMLSFVIYLCSLFAPALPN